MNNANQFYGVRLPNHLFPLFTYCNVYQTPKTNITQSSNHSIALIIIDEKKFSLKNIKGKTVAVTASGIPTTNRFLPER